MISQHNNYSVNMNNPEDPKGAAVGAKLRPKQVKAWCFSAILVAIEGQDPSYRPAIAILKAKRLRGAECWGLSRYSAI